MDINNQKTGGVDRTRRLLQFYGRLLRMEKYTLTNRIFGVFRQRKRKAKGFREIKNGWEKMEQIDYDAGTVIDLDISSILGVFERHERVLLLKRIKE